MDECGYIDFSFTKSTDDMIILQFNVDAIKKEETTNDNH